MNKNKEKQLNNDFRELNEQNQNCALLILRSLVYSQGVSTDKGKQEEPKELVVMK